MLKNVARGVVYLALISLCAASLSFAQGIDLYPGLERNAAMSDQALENMKTSFENLKQGLQMIAQGLPPDQAMMIEQAISMIDLKLAGLDRIDVYTVAETTPGEAYQAVHDFYQTRTTLEDANSAMLKQQLQALQAQGIPPQMLQMFPIPQETIDQLIQLVNENKFQGASGGSGKSRISILTVYVNPANYQVIEGTTVVIATDK